MENETYTQNRQTLNQDLGGDRGITVTNVPGSDENVLVKKFFTSRFEETLIKLHRVLAPMRQELLASRKERQEDFDKGKVPTYLDKTSEAATGDWRVVEIPRDLRVRRVEITGPVNDPKMVINMLNRTQDGHRADTAMLDFEDSMRPTWKNVLNGYENVFRAVRGELEYTKAGPVPKNYRQNPEDSAKLMVRVRGLHMEECNVMVDGSPVSAGLLDLLMVSYYNAKIQIDRDETPKFYIPKCEHYLEARWWAKVLSTIEEELSIPKSSIRATLLIETLPAAFQMEEILFELKDYLVGLNVGRWDKIFSDIKILRNHPDRISPDRASINMSHPWMDNYAKRLVRICHSRGAFAIGGMSAFTPGRTPEMRNSQEKRVRDDKEYEFKIGHDGCWVSHPYFIRTAMESFPKENQLTMGLEGISKYPDLLMEKTGPITLEGLRTNIRVGIAYIKGWRDGLGCVSWDGLMEDLATLEISRAQVWQWLKHKVFLDSGESVTKDLVSQIFSEELERIRRDLMKNAEGTYRPEELERTEKSFVEAARKAEEVFTEDNLRDFFSE